MMPEDVSIAPPQYPSVLREGRVLVQLLTGALICSGYPEPEAALRARALLSSQPAVASASASPGR